MSRHASLPIVGTQEVITPDSTVGRVVAANPGTSRVFERFGIDYCCAGRVSLAHAAAKRSVDLAALITALTQQQRPSLIEEPDWTAASMSDLIAHIKDSHHGYLRRELPRLRAMTTKVAGVHGELHPEMVEVAEIFQKFAADLELHMLKEEQMLFPVLEAFEATGTWPGGAASEPIACMMHEHEDAGGALAQMRRLTEDYTPPPGACATYRATLEGLEALERDMHRHVHKENSILFVRAMEGGGAV